MLKRLSRKFYMQPATKVAQNLLGKFLIRKQREKSLEGVIVETEAYRGFNDLASHAAKGKTKRNEVMYGPAGHAYIYMIYGMYYCLNIVCEERGFPAAVLIRAVEPCKGIQQMIKNRKFKIPKDWFRGHLGKENVARQVKFLTKLTNGPGKVCQAFCLSRKENGEDLVLGKKIWLEDRKIKIKKSDIVSSKRIGVDYAKECKDWPWRFYLKGNLFVSKRIRRKNLA